MWKAWVLAGLWMMAPPLVRAEPADVLELDGIVFAAEHGNLRLLDGSGRGTRDDPYIVAEEIYGEGPSILTIRNVERRFGETARIGMGIGFVLRKVVTNRTGRPWTSFEMELREYLELPSGYFDGLSFAQGLQDRYEHFGSDRFSDIEVYDEPTDRTAFLGTTVMPGETVTMQVAITDHSPQSVFYLLQRADAPLASLEAR